jgi:hypothetical protein
MSLDEFSSGRMPEFPTEFPATTPYPVEPVRLPDVALGIDAQLGATDGFGTFDEDVSWREESPGSDFDTSELGVEDSLFAGPDEVGGATAASSDPPPEHHEPSEPAADHPTDEPAVEHEDPLPASGGDTPPPPPTDNVGLTAAGFPEDRPGRDEHAYGVMPGHDPDGAYPDRGEPVYQDKEGHPVPNTDALDTAHLIIRAREFERQADNPRPEAVPIPSREIRTRATEVLGALQDALADREPRNEVALEKGGILRNYDVQVPSERRPDRNVYYTAQLSYDKPDSPMPRYGNLSVTTPTHGWPHEYYFQAGTARNFLSGDRPHIRYDDYPFHEETTGRPERNTEFAYEQALGMIGLIPPVEEDPRAQ